MNVGRRVHLTQLAQETRHRRSTQKYLTLLGAILGWLGALDQFLLALYLFSTYQPLSAIPPLNEMSLAIYLGVAGFLASAILLLCGGVLMWANKTMTMTIVTLMVGTLGAVLTYGYFAFFSQLALLNWLGPLGILLIAPALISGVLGIYVSRLH